LEDFEKLNVAYEPPLEPTPDLIKISTSNTIPDTMKVIFLSRAERQSEAVRNC